MGPGVGEAPRRGARGPAAALALIACSNQWGRGGSLLVLAVFGVPPEVARVLVPAWWLAAAEVLLGERPPAELLAAAETVEVEGSTCRPCRALKAASSQSWGGRWLERRFYDVSETRTQAGWPPADRSHQRLLAPYSLPGSTRQASWLGVGHSEIAL